MSTSIDINNRANVEDLLQLLEGEASAGHGQALERLLHHTRTSGEASLAPVFTQRGLRVLGRHAFNGPAPTEKGIALRCLSNILVRSVPMRQRFVDEGYPSKVVTLMQDGSCNDGDGVALASLLMYSTVNTSLDLTPSFENDGLAETINKIVLQQSEAWEVNGSDSTLITTLALLSTLAVRYEPHARLFLASVDPILRMLTEADTPSRLQPPTSVLVDCLAALPLHQSETVSVSAVVKLLDVLQTAVSAPRKTDKELLSLLVVILRLAQNKTPAPASELSSHILPSPSDRVTPLGQGSSLPHRLLKLCSATVEPEVREVISSIYFELSDSNPQRFVHHVGFGNAAGFLASRGIQVSQEELTRHQEQANDADINPVTGQLCSEEARVEVPVMTQEEKEREAERLFVLFERLRANGTVCIENPVAQFQQSGRFEELSDDES